MRRMSSLILLLFAYGCSSLLTACHTTCSTKQSGQQVQRNGWTFTDLDGVGLWVALNKFVDVPPGNGYRTIVAYMDDKNFNPGTLRTLFTSLAKEYKEPRDLAIYVYSDEETTTNEARSHAFPLTGVPANTNKGQKQEKAQKSYLYARYSRQKYYVDGVRRELFTFTPDQNSREKIEVVIGIEEMPHRESQ